MIPVSIHEEDGMEDLHGHVCVHGGSDVRNARKIAIDKFTQAGIIFHCTPAAATAHIQFEIRDAEGVLHVDQHQPGSSLVGRRWLERVKTSPVPRLSSARFVGNPPDRANTTGFKKNWGG